MANQFNVTSLDTDDLKQSLIQFVQEKPEFSDIDYEGSAINTIVDLLVYNANMISYQANMVANESFLDTAQIRRNVISHAQKLSYTPRSSTASRLVCDIEVKPVVTTNLPSTIVMEIGTPFIGSVGGQSYTFTNTSSYVLTYSNTDQVFKQSDVELFQGAMITETTQYISKQKIPISNKNCDTNTLRVISRSQQGNDQVFTQATSLTELSSDSSVYFLSEGGYDFYQIEFGRDVIGVEPPNASPIEISYIATEQNHANGVNILTAASIIANYSNISVNITTPAYGGYDKEDIESVRFYAPKNYRSQDRALSAFDYTLLVKSQYPFIKSVISWGGEDNIPPVYGSVFVSILPELGISVTRSLKERIESSIKEKGVGSVVPSVVSPNIFNLDLNIRYRYNKVTSGLSRDGIETKMSGVVTTYNEDSLRMFGSYFNESELISRLKKYRSLETVIIDEIASTQLDVSTIKEAYYDVNFDNALEKGTVEISQFTISSDVSNERIIDDRNGKMIYSFTSNGIETSRSVGTVNYDTGAITVIAAFSNISERVKFFAELADENFYVKRNNVVQISDVRFEEMV